MADRKRPRGHDEEGSNGKRMRMGKGGEDDNIFSIMSKMDKLGSELRGGKSAQRGISDVEEKRLKDQITNDLYSKIPTLYDSVPEEERNNNTVEVEVRVGRIPEQTSKFNPGVSEKDYISLKKYLEGSQHYAVQDETDTVDFFYTADESQVRISYMNSESL